MYCFGECAARRLAQLEFQLEPSPLVLLLWPGSLPVINFILQLAFSDFIRLSGELSLQLCYSRFRKLGAC